MENLHANFSMLTMSIASSAAMSLGITDEPGAAKTKDKPMAKFNIDLLLMLREKTKGNLTPEENNLLEQVLTDLQLKFCSNK